MALHVPCLQPPTAWAAALRHPRAAAHQQCWHVLARLLVKLEESGHLPPGKACKALHLAQSLQVRAQWRSCSYNMDVQATLCALHWQGSMPAG